MNKDSQFITGLKALGAIMVVISHLNMRLSGYSDIGWKFILFSANFIILFICISAFTICMSLDKQKKFQFIPYMKRRWLRLAPSYYLILLIGVLYKISTTGWNLFDAAKNLMYSMLFLNIDGIATQYQASILSVEWMLPIIFWFYVLIPPLLFLVKSRPFIFTMVFALSIFLYFHHDALTTYTGFGGFGWSMQAYFFMYAYTIGVYFLFIQKSHLVRIAQLKTNHVVSFIGASVGVVMLLYYIQSNSERFYAISLLFLTGYLLFAKDWALRICTRISKTLGSIVNNADIVLLLIIILKYMINVYQIQYPHLIVSLWFVALLIAGFYRPTISRILFENRLMQFIGVISFGLYLIHPLVILIIERLIPMDNPILRIIMIFSCSILAAYALHLVVNRKASMVQRSSQ